MLNGYINGTEYFNLTNSLFNLKCCLKLIYLPIFNFKYTPLTDKFSKFWICAFYSPNFASMNAFCTFSAQNIPVNYILHERTIKLLSKQKFTRSHGVLLRLPIITSDSLLFSFKNQIHLQMRNEANAIVNKERIG